MHIPDKMTLPAAGLLAEKMSGHCTRTQEHPMQGNTVTQKAKAEFLHTIGIRGPQLVMTTLLHFIDALATVFYRRTTILNPCCKHECRGHGAIFHRISYPQLGPSRIFSESPSSEVADSGANRFNLEIGVIEINNSWVTFNLRRRIP
jgi:hypothetical protein